MFVRWKKNKLRRGVSLTAVLVESRRVNGKPRLKIIVTLATIKESAMDSYGWGRYGTGGRKPFWERIEARLDWLNLGAEIRAKIASEVARRVPQWTPEDEAQLNAKNTASCDAYIAKLRKKWGVKQEAQEEERFQNARVVSKRV